MEYFETINAAVTVCDMNGTIIYMNDRSGEIFQNDGGKLLIGQSLFDCHPEPALTKLKEMLATGRTNVYTIEKNGKKKIIYQSPWRKDGAVAGLVEMSYELPDAMEHFVRQ
ncbi:MAG: PAS domain-containing protein [Bacteroidota bacterium]